MQPNRKVVANKTTYQSRKNAAAQPPRGNNNDPRAQKRSAFLITINTNVAISDDDAADEMGGRLQQVIDEMAYTGGACAMWGEFFRVNVGRGRKWMDKKQTIPNPNHDPEFNKYYANDDKQGQEHWCSFFDRIEVAGAGVEWAPGTKKGKNQYLHAHIMVKLRHRTRLIVDIPFVAAYIWDKMGSYLPHKPYVHVDVVKDTTQKVIEYVTKNAWNQNSQVIDNDTVEFFSQF